MMKYRNLVALLLGALLSCAALAQVYPSRAIRIVVPFSAGGGGDAVGRVVALKMSESLGQQVYIDSHQISCYVTGPAEHAFLMADAG